MSKMQPVTLSYNGKEYEVSAEDGIWGLIEAVEDVVTYMELLPKLVANQIPATKVFRAFAAALQYAGARGVTMHDIREAADYSALGEMAAQIIAILQMGQPGQGFAADDSTLPPEEVEEQKKKAGGE